MRKRARHSLMEKTTKSAKVTTIRRENLRMKKKHVDGNNEHEEGDKNGIALVGGEGSEPMEEVLHDLLSTFHFTGGKELLKAS